MNAAEARRRLLMIEKALAEMQDGKARTRVELFGDRREDERWPLEVLRRLIEDGSVERVGRPYLPKYQVRCAFEVNTDLAVSLLRPRASTMDLEAWGRAAREFRVDNPAVAHLLNMCDLRMRADGKVLRILAPSATVVERLEKRLVGISGTLTWAFNRPIEVELVLPEGANSGTESVNSEPTPEAPPEPEPAPESVNNGPTPEVPSEPEDLPIALADSARAIDPSSKQEEQVAPAEMLAALVKVVPLMVDAIHRIEQRQVKMAKQLAHLYKELAGEP